MIAVQKSFKAAIRALLRTMKDLPALPSQYRVSYASDRANRKTEQKKLGMSMSFRSDCPQQYQPLGFQSARDHSLDMQDWNKLWQLPTSPTITFEPTHHIVKIATRNKEYEEQTASQLQDTIMSKHIHNMQRTSSNRHNGVESTMPVPATPAQSLQVAALKERTARKRTHEKAALEDNGRDRCSNGSDKDVITPRRRRISISRMLVTVNKPSSASELSVSEDEYRFDEDSERSMQSKDDFASYGGC